MDLGTKLVNLIEVRTTTGDGAKEVPILPLPVVLFVSDAVALVQQGRSLDELPQSLPDVYANYLRRINPKLPGMANCMGDEDMLRAAKALARLAVGTITFPKEFEHEDGLESLKTDAPNLHAAVSLLRLVANGVLVSREGMTTFLRFALDPVVRQNQIAGTILTFNNLEGTISRHVRIPTRLVSVDLAVQQRPSSPPPGKPCTQSTVRCLQAAQQASAVKALRSHVLDHAGRTLEGLATGLGSGAPRYGRSLATAALS